MMEIPTVEREDSVPHGVLYAASSVQRHGHNVKLVDLVKEDVSYTDIKKIIEEFSPGLIGLGGITSSYKACKELVNNIKNALETKNITFKVKKEWGRIYVYTNQIKKRTRDLVLPCPHFAKTN